MQAMQKTTLLNGLVLAIYENNYLYGFEED